VQRILPALGSHWHESRSVGVGVRGEDRVDPVGERPLIAEGRLVAALRRGRGLADVDVDRLPVDRVERVRYAHAVSSVSTSSKTFDFRQSIVNTPVLADSETTLVPLPAACRPT
jgi:hypothetical protein